MNPQLLHEARQLLARASVLSEVTARRPNPSKSGHTKPDGSRPFGTDWGVFDDLAAAMGECTSDRELERFVGSARLELRRWTTTSAAGVVTETTREFRLRVLREHSTKSVREAAAIENVPKDTIQRIRTWAKQQQEAA